MAWDAQLRIDGVAGESLRARREGDIEIKSFSFGAHNQASMSRGRGMATSAVDIRRFVVTKKTDASSAELFQHCCGGQHFATGRLILHKSGGDAGPLEYLTYEFANLYVEDIDWTGSEGGEEVPDERISFAFSKVSIVYSEQNTDGTRGGAHVGSWNLLTSQPD